MFRRTLTAAAALLAVTVLAVAACAEPAHTPPPAASPSPSAPAGPGVAVDSPIGLAVTADGGVWAASADRDAVVQLDPATGAVVRTVAVGRTPLRLAADGDLLWVSVFRHGRLLGVDTATGAVKVDVPAPDGPEGVAVGLGSVWLVRQDANTLSRFDRTGHRLADVPVPGGPRLAAVGAGAVWVSSYQAGTLTRVEASGRARTSPKLCDGAQGLLVRGDVVWVTCTGGDEVLAVDAASLRVLGRVAVTGEPDAILAAGDRLLVVATKGPTLVELSTDPAAPHELRRTVLGGARPLRDAANGDAAVVGGQLWVSSVSQDGIYRVPLP
ncbi:hypothetical protein Cs7R123_60260 [Catellatospora sp. TT07R-123]|uniref:Vgb family protein n=1 Tax=Catellatospora sp. TT07R-123 TaxID=2733863 RepID=UPI001B11D6D5|nr:hypothetical protein [Catellatospora sp. TT07R-123]GHJ48684.1 hypothetical protein Cs7R123_60260 [Catellatospora sp. TT07R-123]